MAFKQITVPDSSNNIITINTFPDAGVQLSSNSLSVVIANDYAFVVNNIPSVGPKSSANSLPVVVANDSSITVNNLPSIGPKSSANSLPVVIANDSIITVNNQITLTTSNALEPPTAIDATKIIANTFTLVSNTVLQIAPARPGRIAWSIQCANGGVVISETGANLQSSSFGANGQTSYVPSGAQPYFTPPIATRTAITAITNTPQSVVVTEYLR